MTPLDELVARQQITDLFDAYAYHFDRNEPELVAALFTDDATIDYGPEFPLISGRAAIAPRISVGLRETFSATSHHISNVSVTFDAPDRAHGLAYVYAWQRFHSGAPDGELWAQYQDEFRRTTDGWRIHSLQLRAAGTRNFHRSEMHSIGRRGDDA